MKTGDTTNLLVGASGQRVELWYIVLTCYLSVLGFLSLNPWIRPVSTESIFSPDKLDHAFAYGGLAVILFLCFAKSRDGSSRNTTYAWIAALLIAVMIGVLIEVTQSLFTRNRAGSVEDVLANAIGVVLGCAVYNTVKYIFERVVTKA